MATRNDVYEYVTKTMRNGKTITTLSVRLYAPDGSVFVMPHGGDPVIYIKKGYKIAPDEDWREKNRVYEEAKAESLKLSNFQREIKNREKELEAKQERARLMAEMERQNEAMQAAEDALNASPEPEHHETIVDPEPEPESVESSIIADSPKPKAKAKAPAKRKAKAKV